MATYAREREKEYLDKVALKVQRLSNLFSELSESFSQIAGNEQRPVEAEMAPFINDIVNRACKTCLLKDRCWGKDFYRNFRWIINLLAQTEGEIKEYHLSPDFRVKCRSPASLLTAINCSREVWKANRYWVNKLTEERSLVSSQLRGVSHIMDEMAEEIKTDSLPPANERVFPLFTVEVGVAQKPGRGQKVCGDYYSFFEFGENLQVLVLSDGMGHGPRARAESKAAVRPVSYTHLDVYKRQVHSGEELFQRTELEQGVDHSDNHIFAKTGLQHLFNEPYRRFAPVSYTHLDVYKRQS